jgi:hypothetical protein
MAALATAMLLAAPAGAAKPPDTWDGLSKVNSKRLDIAYLQPGADFRAYKSVMVDPTEIAFQKDYVRDFNRTTRGLSERVSDRDVEKVVQEAVGKATDIFAEAFSERGYPVVQEAGPDVLRVKTAILNVSVSSPDRMTAGRSYSFANEAGQATFAVEVRDSQTGALLGRAVDGRVAGDTTIGWRNKVTNRADFRQLAKSWAESSVKGLNELKALSPIDEQGLVRK